MCDEVLLVSFVFGEWIGGGFVVDGLGELLKFFFGVYLVKVLWIVCDMGVFV